MSLARTQIDGYRAAFTQLVGTESFAAGFRWSFRAQPGLESHLRDLAEREAGCCPFMSYALTSDGDHIVWEVRAREDAAAVVEEYSRLPQRLAEEPRPGPDVALLMRTSNEAGLSFAVGQAPPRPAGPLPCLPGQTKA